jgi:hypothetical protein
MSLVVVIFAAYEATMKRFGSVSLEHSAYFLGSCAGPYLFSAIIVLAFYKITDKKAADSTKLLAAFCAASLFAVVSLLNTNYSVRSMPTKTDVASDTLALAPSPKKIQAVPSRAATPWDPAIISLYTDLQANNEAYVTAVSHLDVTSQTLYLPDSFRDAATIQKVLDQLHDRLSVADQFSSLAPVLAKMPDYIAAINASESDKRAFLATFMPAVQQSVAKRNVASAYEHDWLRTTIALYQFMLANQGAYTISADGRTGMFRSHATGADFDQRLRKSQQLKQQFLQANGAYLASQSAARAQMGMPD